MTERERPTERVGEAPGPRRRPSIPTRILLGFVLILVAFTTVSVFSLARHQATTRTLRLFREGYVPLVLQVGKATTDQRLFRTVLDRVLEERDSKFTRNWLRIVREGRPRGIDKALELVARARSLGPAADDAALLESIAAQLRAVKHGYAEAEADYARLYAALDALEEVRGPADRPDDAELSAAARIRADLTQQEHLAERRLRRASNTLENRIQGLSARAAAREREAVMVLGLLALGTLLVGVTVTVWARRLLLPLPRLQARVAAVARGDLSARLEPVRDDELGRLTREFESMVDALAARDRSLRRAAEARRRLERMREQIVADLRTALLVIDPEGTVRVANPASAGILGVGPEDVGSPLDASGLLDRVEGLRGAIAEVREGADRAVLEGVALTPGERRVDVLVSPFETLEAGAADAPVTGAVLLVADDVTEALSTKERLIQTERLAAIGRMAAHVTHEVRNPLSSIGLNVDLLEDEIDDAGEEARVLLRAIRTEIDRLTGVTEEYLRLARLPAPTQEPEDAGALLRELASFVEPELREAGHDLRVDVGSVDDAGRDPADSPRLRVHVDEGQLRQALLNLIRNAKEAMPAPGCIELRAARGDVDDGRPGVRIDVADEGTGISPEARERLFEPFFTTKAVGTGLGLSLTQQIVAAHGGRIACAPRPGGGTVFSVWLPALDADGSARPGPARERPSGSEPPPLHAPADPNLGPGPSGSEPAPAPPEPRP